MESRPRCSNTDAICWERVAKNAERTATAEGNENLQK